MLIVHLFVSYAHINLCHLFSSSLCQGLAATSACGSSWTFLFTFLLLQKRLFERPFYPFIHPSNLPNVLIVKFIFNSAQSSTCTMHKEISWTLLGLKTVHVQILLFLFSLE